MTKSPEKSKLPIIHIAGVTVGTGLFCGSSFTFIHELDRVGDKHNTGVKTKPDGEESMFPAGWMDLVPTIAYTAPVGLVGLFMVCSSVKSWFDQKSR